MSGKNSAKPMAPSEDRSVSARNTRSRDVLLEKAALKAAICSARA